MTKFVPVIIALSLSAGAARGTQIPESISTLGRQYQMVLNACPERIWKGYNGRETVIVMVDSSSQRAYGWDGKDGSITPMNYSTLPPDIVESSYNFFQAGHRFGLSVKVDTLKETFETGVHELFHGWGQQDWKKTGQGRGTSYPLSWEARYYRHQLFDQLLRAARTGDRGVLYDASYWYHRWKSEFPEEFLNSADGYEGSAQYYQIMANAIVQKGCGASMDSLKAAALANLEDEIRSFRADRSIFSLDFEGYELGALAILLLNELYPDGDWPLKISQGKQPTELLLEGLNQAAPAHNEPLAATIRKGIEAENSKISKLVDRDIKNTSDKNFVRMVVPMQWLLSNFMPVAFVMPRDLPGTTMAPLRTEHRMEAPNSGQGQLVVKTGSVVNMGGADTPCGSVHTLIHKDSIKSQNGRMIIESALASGEFKGSFKRNAEGYTFLCIDDIP